MGEKKKKQILFVNTTLTTGGIASSLYNFYSILEKIEDINVDILLLNEKYIDERYEKLVGKSLVSHGNYFLQTYYTGLRELLSKHKYISCLVNVFLRFLNKILSPEKFLKFLFTRKKLSKKYDYAISFRNNEYKNPLQLVGCQEYVLNAVNADEKIAWIHNEPKRHGITNEIAKKYFNEFDYIINVSEGCKNQFDEIIPELKSKSKMIYNPFLVREIRDKSNEKSPFVRSEKMIFVTVGRIDSVQKKWRKFLKFAENLIMQVRKIINGI